jgi:hypothetical protein
LLIENTVRPKERSPEKPKLTQESASQFKVNFTQLREVFSEGDWAKKNILIAVAGGADDGT